MNASRLRVVVSTLALASLALTLVAAKPAHAPAKLPSASAILTADIAATAYDDVTPLPGTFEDGVLSFTNTSADVYIIVNFTLPAGVTIDGASVAVDATEHLDWEIVGNELKVFGLSLGTGQVLTAEVSGTHTLDGGEYRVSAQYKTVEPRRPNKQLTMWQEKVTGGFVVDTFVPPPPAPEPDPEAGLEPMPEVDLGPLPELLIEEPVIEPVLE